MKKKLMKRAWEIFRTLSGDKRAKLKTSLKEAWFEMKNACVKEETQFDLPQLEGTEKQVAWAQELRKRYLEWILSFIKSDEMFDNPVSRNTAGTLASSIYHNGITNSGIKNSSFFWKHETEAREKGINFDLYENEKFHEIFGCISFQALRGKPQIEKIRAEKKVLEYVLYETLKIDIQAKYWIERFKYTRFDPYYQSENEV